MAYVEVPGGYVEVPDDLTGDQVQALMKPHMDRLRVGAPDTSAVPASAQAAPTAAQDYYSQRMSPDEERNRGLAQRAVIQAPVGAALGMAGLAGDALVNTAYGGMKALSKTGLVDPPDPKNYYKGSGQTYFPVSEMIGKIGAAPANALNLPVPETSREKIASGALEGGLSALTGVGAGRALAGLGAQAIGRALSATPVAQIASGVLGGGVGAATENAPAAIAASLAPAALLARRGRPGRVSASTPEGQELVARRILADEAGPDLPKAQQNIDEYLAGDRTVNPGFQLSTPNAALSERLAVLDPKWREMAQPLPIDLKRNNDTILSQGLDKWGAVRGTSETTRKEAGRIANADKAAMGLQRQPRVDIMDEIADVNRRNRTNAGLGVSDATQEALDYTAKKLEKSQKPRYSIRADTGGSGLAAEKDNLINTILGKTNTEIAAATQPKPELIGKMANLNDLMVARTDIATGRWNEGKPATPAVQGAMEKTRPVLNSIDSILNEQTGGQWNQYLDKQRTIRKKADAQGYMQDFAERVSNKDRTYPSGARYIDEGAWLQRMMAKNEDVNIKGANPGRGVSLSKLEEISPARGAFLRGATQDIKAGSWAESLPGAKTRGSNTSQNLDFNQVVNQAVLEHSGPAARAAMRTAKLLNVGVGGAGRIMSAVSGGALGGVTQALGRGSASLLTNVAENANARNIQAVRGIIGQAWEPAEFARLMRLQEPQQRTWGQAGARAVRGTSRLGYQGLLAGGQRQESRYR